LKERETDTGTGELAAAMQRIIGEPETNGVIERFFQAIKEQIVHGRIYQTVEEVRAAVRGFVAPYTPSG
jgi:hypothetical protein